VTSILQAGAMLLLRKVHKEQAGPWLAAFGASFVSAGKPTPQTAVLLLLLRPSDHVDAQRVKSNVYLLLVCGAGIVVPAVQLLVSGLSSQFLLFSVLVLGGAGWLLTLPPLREDVPHPATAAAAAAAVSTAPAPASAATSAPALAEDDTGVQHEQQQEKEQEKLPPQEQEQPPPPPHYRAECVVAAMIFFAIGGGDSLTFYLETYVAAAASSSSSSSAGGVGGCNKELLLLCFFASATLGDVLGLLAQVRLSDSGLARQAAGIFVTGAAGMLLVILRPASPAALWLGVCVFGLCNAPSISYCFNLAHRLSHPSATSTSLVMLGLSLGVSLMPYLTSLVWRALDLPLALMYVGCASALVPVLLLLVAPSFSYLKAERGFTTFF
jgi:hypothetical protein